MGTSGLGDTDGAGAGRDHGPAVADHQELSFIRLSSDESSQPLHIDAIKEAVDFIERIKRGGPEALQRKEKAEGCERLLTTRHGGQAPYSFALGMSHQGQSSLKRIIRVIKRQLTFTIGKASKDRAEVSINSAIGLHKSLLGEGGHGLNSQQQLLPFTSKHLKSLTQLQQAGFELLQLIESKHVDRLQGFHALLDQPQLLLQRFQPGLPEFIADLRQGIGELLLLALELFRQSAALIGKRGELLGQPLKVPLPLLLLLAQLSQAGFCSIASTALLAKTGAELLLLLLELFALLPISQLLSAQLLHLSGQGSCSPLQPLLFSGDGIELAAQASQHQIPFALGRFEGIAALTSSAEIGIGTFKLLLQSCPASRISLIGAGGLVRSLGIDVVGALVDSECGAVAAQVEYSA